MERGHVIGNLLFFVKKVDNLCLLVNNNFISIFFNKMKNSLPVKFA